MELTNDCRVGVPVETAWEVLTDVERIAQSVVVLLPTPSRHST